jgi:hypothetical protein
MIYGDVLPWRSMHLLVGDLGVFLCILFGDCIDGTLYAPSSLISGDAPLFWTYVT